MDAPGGISYANLEFVQRVLGGETAEEALIADLFTTEEVNSLLNAMRAELEAAA